MADFFGLFMFAFLPYATVRNEYRLFYRLNKLNSILINLNLLSSPTQKKNKGKKSQKQKKLYTQTFFCHSNIQFLCKPKIKSETKSVKWDRITQPMPHTIHNHLPGHGNAPRFAIVTSETHKTYDGTQTPAPLQSMMF